LKNYDYYLSQIPEVGFVIGLYHSVVVVDGLPGAHLNEIVIFQNGGIGQVFSLASDRVEVLLLKSVEIAIGTSLVRTGEALKISIDESILGKTISPLGDNTGSESHPVEKKPLGILGRKSVEKFFETGVSLVDLIIPLGKGQRELVIGDRKTGKTEFLLQSAISHAKSGGIVVYAIIGQKQSDILKRAEFFKDRNISNQSVIVASNAEEPPGLIFQTPYTACTVSEYFADKGYDVLLILDDMTSHARYYREISLLSRRFPGKDSYPGDIFYAQAKIVERAGNFAKGSITCLPVAESVAGDLSGFIQTNLMAMTDGHLFFDSDLYNQGKRPSINPTLSVTRVGHQTQSPLMRDISRVLSNFIVSYEKMKQYKHFGAEAGELVKDVLEIGTKLDTFLNQPEFKIIPINANVFIVGLIWANVTDNIDYDSIYDKYLSEPSYKKSVDDLIVKSTNFDALVRSIKEDLSLVISKK
jgi:F-type H+-transporting ATPase subunit alpha